MFAALTAATATIAKVVLFRISVWEHLLASPCHEGFDSHNLFGCSVLFAWCGKMQVPQLTVQPHQFQFLHALDMNQNIILN
jgi:hypothetical protein